MNHESCVIDRDMFDDWVRGQAGKVKTCGFEQNGDMHAS